MWVGGDRFCFLAVLVAEKLRQDLARRRSNQKVHRKLKKMHACRVNKRSNNCMEI